MPAPGGMAALRVLVCSQITGLCEAVERSAAAAGCRVALQQRTPAEIERGGAHHEDWRSARVVLADPGSIAHMVDDAAALHWMQATWAGVNSVFALSKKRDFTLTRLGGCFGTQMSEYVLGYVLMHERRLLQATHDQVERRWQPDAYKPSDPLGPRPLDSLTLGMLGCGDIGSLIAKAVKGLGMRVVAFRKNQGRQDVSVDKMVTSVADVLAESDYIVNILPSTPDTRGLLGLDTWLHCAARGPSRRPPVFINVGRGDVTSEDALLGALDQGLLQAAVLDVFEVRRRAGGWEFEWELS